MFVYAGIDEAGYGPAFGPMTVGRCVLRVPRLDPPSPEAAAKGLPPRSRRPPASLDGVPDLWKRLSSAVCKTLNGAKGRVVVNDSKRLTTKAAGIRHLELGCLAFASLMGLRPSNVCDWLDGLGEVSHRELAALPWYVDDCVGPWAELPRAVDPGELAIARGMLERTCRRIGVEVADLGVAVLFEDRFNQMVRVTRSKAAVSFTFVAGHLRAIWEAHGHERPTVVVDRQSGRMRYRDVLAQNFEGCEVSVLRESPGRSSYFIEGGPVGGQIRSMIVHFCVDAEASHMPVALASMLAKYNRELLMERFKAYFTAHLPHVAPTAGYGQDAGRFWRELQPELGRLKLDPRLLRRLA